MAENLIKDFAGGWSQDAGFAHQKQFEPRPAQIASQVACSAGPATLVTAGSPLD